MAIALCASSMASAEDAPWLVKKASGEVWTTTSGVQQASLTQESALKPGDTIRTGRNGRVLLVRGEETIMVSPNSVIGIPAEQKEGLATTIVQRAGSILLEVEKRNVKHFEVETPFLAAVVKGTQFRVSVNAAGASVEVLRGQVEVADFRSGQIGQVFARQVAAVSAQGKSGLSLGGVGRLSPVEQGNPRKSSVDRVIVPKDGLSAPRRVDNDQQIRAVGQMNRATATTNSQQTLAQPQRTAVRHQASHAGIRISSALGEVSVNFHKVTHGMARGSVPSAIDPSRRRSASQDTIWTSREAKANTGAGSNSNQGNSGDANSGSGVATATSASAVAAAGAVRANRSENANGNGGLNANANANGNGNGNRNEHENGNGNGNAYGSGNGNAYGHGRGHGRS